MTHRADERLAAAAGFNARDVLGALRARTNRASADERKIRRALSAALPPSTLHKADTLKWRKFMQCSSHANIAPMVALRRRFMDESEGLLSVSVGGRPRWEADPEHARWADQFTVWIANKTRVAPGKRTMCHQHVDSTGKTVLHHGKDPSTGRRKACQEGACQHHVLHYKTDTNVNLHRGFLRDHPHIDPQRFNRQRFDGMMPFWVKPKPRKVCVCPHCSQAKHLLAGLRAAVGRLHGEDCKCQCALCVDGGCKTAHDSVDKFIDTWLCDHDAPIEGVFMREDDASVNGMFARVKCVLGSCEKCKDQAVAPLFVCPLESAHDADAATWKEMVKESNMVHTASGLKEQKNVHAKVQRGTIRDLKLRVHSCFAGDRTNRKRVKWHGWTQDESFFVHVFVNRWQSEALNHMLSTLRADAVLVTMDCAMNCAHKHDVEFSEEHFAPWSSTVLPLVCFHRDRDGIAKGETFVVLSDDLRHDHSAVQAHLKDAIQHHRIRFAERDEVLRRCVVFSDGCAAQFKTASIFGALPSMFNELKHKGPDQLPTLPVVTGFNDSGAPMHFPSAVEWARVNDMRPVAIEGVRVCWNFFQSHHGKGPSDSENASVKGFLSRREENGHCMPCTIDITKALVNGLTKTSVNKTEKNRKKFSVWRRQFAHCPCGTIDRKGSVRVDKAVKWTRTHHRHCTSIDDDGVAQLDAVNMGWLSCACALCMEAGVEHENCTFSGIVNANTDRKPKKNMSSRRVQLVARRLPSRRRRTPRNLEGRVLNAIRTRGHFNFCRDMGGTLGMGAAVSLTTDENCNLAVEYHVIAEVAGADNRCVMDSKKADDVVLLTNMLPSPMGFRLTEVVGSFGVLKAAPGVRQQLLNAMSALKDPDADDTDDDDD